MNKNNKRIQLPLKSENVRNLSVENLHLVVGGGRTQGSVVVGDCGLVRTQLCDQRGL